MKTTAQEIQVGRRIFYSVRHWVVVFILAFFSCQGGDGIMVHDVSILSRKRDDNNVRYRDVVFSSAVQLFDDLIYGAAVNPVTGKVEKLTMDVFAPAGDPTPINRYAYVHLHGGGFTKGSNKWGVENVKNMALRGYVAFTINYRLTTVQEGPPYAAADLGTAISFIRANASLFGIAEDKIVSGGESAGGIASLLVASATLDSQVTKSAGKSYVPNLRTAVSATLTAVTSSGELLQGASWNYLSEVDPGEPPAYMWGDKSDPIVWYSVQELTFAALTGIPGTSGVSVNLGCHTIYCFNVKIRPNVVEDHVALWIWSRLNGSI